MSTSRTVAVAGATGNQGGAVARALLQDGNRVLALTRRPQSAAADALRRDGAEVVAAYLDDRATLTSVFRRSDAVFGLTTPYEAGAQSEIAQGMALIDAAAAAEVPHFVFSSIGSADRGTGIPHFEAKARVEERLAQTSIPWTILGPVFFMENYTSPWWMPALQEGVLPMALPPNRSLQQVAVRDIGKFAAVVFSRPEEFAGRRIDLASHELTAEHAARIISKASGREIRYVELPLEEMHSKGRDFALMFGWFDQVGYTADIAGLRERFPEVGWRTFEEWAQEQDWSEIRV